MRGIGLVRIAGVACGLLLTALCLAAPEQAPLSGAERAWLSAHPVIRVGVDVARAPIQRVHPAADAHRAGLRSGGHQASRVPRDK